MFVLNEATAALIVNTSFVFYAVFEHFFPSGYAALHIRDRPAPPPIVNMPRSG